MFFGNWVNIDMQIAELISFLKEIHSFIDETNEDLQLLCECCESNVADAEFPHEELCKECAKERSDE